MSNETYILLFPILFAFHELEEIIGFPLWASRNTSFFVHQAPDLLNTYKGCTSRGFALAALEEYILCLLLCALACSGYAPLKLQALWFGAFIAFSLHLIVHIGMSLAFSGYVPSLITSLICLPFSTYVIYKFHVEHMVYNTATTIALLSGMMIVFLNFRFAIKLIKK